MIYIAECRACKRVVACCKTNHAVQDWLNKGLYVRKTDFDKDNPLKPFDCQFCKSNAERQASNRRSTNVEHRSIAEQHQQWCIHYRGPHHNDTCEAGVNYEDLMNVAELGRTGCMLRLPCIRRHHTDSERKGEPLMPCAKCQWPTLEESQEHERRAHAHTFSLLLARAAIGEHSGGKRGVSGELDCPVCEGGPLRYSIAGCNGHTHAACTTTDCVRWME